MKESNEQEIDLRPYVTSLWDKRYWIIGFGLLGVVLGLAISSLIPRSYEATALVASTLPRELIEFDARIQAIADSQPLEAYPELALSDAILVELLNHISVEPPLTLTKLRKMVDTSVGSDPSIIKLTVEYTDAEIAAEMANTWAELFVSWANKLYGYQGDEQLVFFEARLSEAATQLEAAEIALGDFQINDRASILSNELLAAQQTQADYLAKQRQTELILQDVESLLPQMPDDNLTDPITVEELASILLQVRALSGVADTSAMPLQIQLNVEGPTDADGTGNRETIIQLRDMLVSQSSQLEERLSALEPQILSLQQEKYQMEVINNRLNRDLEVAEETYTTLARTVDEKRITSEDTTSGIKLASQTAIPDQPSGPNVILNAIVAGMAGIFLSALVIILVQWGRAEDRADHLADTNSPVHSLSEGEI
ncbi:MAG: hypothetical protein KA586_05720 [Candidatus Promineofilum sp.]|nr:hypothetical protein [Promineifilum sp.]